MGRDNDKFATIKQAVVATGSASEQRPIKLKTLMARYGDGRNYDSFFTKNRGKAREIQAMLSGVVARVESLADHPQVELPPEGAHSYRENALEKARAVWRALGVPALGDDSGLEVEIGRAHV